MKLSRGRKQPYDSVGILQFECSRPGCNRQAKQQWQACADGNLYRPICTLCDVELNAIALAFMSPYAWRTKLWGYAHKTLGREHGKKWMISWIEAHRHEWGLES